MKKKAKKIFVMFMAVTLLCIFTISIPAMAANPSVSSPKVVTDNSFLFSGNHPNITVKLTQNIVANKTTQQYHIICNPWADHPNDTTVVLYFKNTQTNRTYALAFEADGKAHSNVLIGVDVPQGTYNVTVASAYCDILQMTWSVTYNK